MTENDPIKTDIFFERVKEKTAAFSDLIDKIEGIPGESRSLWKEIYENALEDRSNAYILFVDLYKEVANSAAGHMNHGGTLTKYLERMNKANDQLLKLAELIEDAKSASVEIDNDDLYDQIEKKK